MIVATITLLYAGSFLLTALSNAYAMFMNATPHDRFQSYFLLAQFPPTAIGAILAGPMIDIKSGATRHFLAGLVVSMSLFTVLGYFSYRLAGKMFAADDAKARAGK
jgi:hypothetical protein